MRNNCLLFALYKWFKFGGYVITRKSNFGWWPHFIWSKDLITFEEYIPSEHQEGLKFPPLYFKGYIRRFEVRK